MGLFTPNKRATYRKFSYEPRFYDPRKDEKLRQRIRVGRKAHRGKPGRAVAFALLLVAALYLYLTLS